MARARNIKPGFFSNDALVELSFEVRLLFIGLWTIADKEGRLIDRPKKIKMELFPADSVDCDSGLTQLYAKGFIKRYEVAGAKYIQIMNWKKHQSPHIKEVSSEIPEFPERAPDIPGISGTSTSVAALIPDSGFPLPDSGLRIPDSSSLRSPPAAQSTRSRVVRAEPPEFAEIRHEYPRRAGGQRWGDALKFYLRNRDAGVSHEVMLEGCRRYRRFLQATGDECQKTVQQAATFLGENKGYLELWHAPPRKVELSPIERVRMANGLGRNDERVVSEQNGNGSSGESLGSPFGDVWDTPSPGLRRIGS